MSFINLFLYLAAPICDDPLNLNEILQSVAPTPFGQNSIRKSTVCLFSFSFSSFLESTPSVSHAAMTRQYPSTSITHSLTVNLTEFLYFIIEILF